MSINPIPDAELAELDRLHEAATKGMNWHEVALWKSAISQRYPSLRQRLNDAESRLEAAERERDTATDDEAGHWIGIIRSLDPENLCDVFDGLGFEENLRQWLTARDTQQRREGAARGIEQARDMLSMAESGEEADEMMRQAAKRLRESD